MTAFFSKKFLIISFVLCMFAVSKRIGSVVRTGIERNMSSNKILDMNGLLLDWYEQNRRDLPWRNTQDPYLIWVSDIILQQTRVAQGLDYFVRFTNRFPDVAALASASEEEVLKYWQGLGYYSRARNMHAAARMVMEQHGGIFPSDYASVRALKGIGDYTAAAIVSFAWNQPYPVVDGNVYRVLSRWYALDTPIDSTSGKKLFAQLAEEQLNRKAPGLHNQAMMELGAIQCVPQHPDCGVCPFQEHCLAYATGRVDSYPVKQGKTKVRDRYFNYLYIIYNGDTWIHRRDQQDIWKGLYEWPLIETGQAMDWAELQQTERFREWFEGCGRLACSRELIGMKHVLSHQILHVNFYRVQLEQVGTGLDSFLRVPIDRLEQYPVSRLIHISWEKMGRNLAE